MWVSCSSRAWRLLHRTAFWCRGNAVHPGHSVRHGMWLQLVQHSPVITRSRRTWRPVVQVSARACSTLQLSHKWMNVEGSFADRGVQIHLQSYVDPLNLFPFVCYLCFVISLYPHSHSPLKRMSTFILSCNMCADADHFIPNYNSSFNDWCPFAWCCPLVAQGFSCASRCCVHPFFGWSHRADLVPNTAVFLWISTQHSGVVPQYC